MSEGLSLRHSVTFHDGGSRDLDAVSAIMQAAFDPRFGEGWTRSQCAGILPMPGVRLVLARTGEGEPAGFSLFRVSGGEAELLLLAVHPEHRRNGIGRGLLDGFIREAQEQGLGKVHLEVREGNPAVLLYRAAGFTAVGRRRKYYRGLGGGEFDALTLSKSLLT
jgi:[ribosomal protein S18]-alanine N-acetyltransferase